METSLKQNDFQLALGFGEEKKKEEEKKKKDIY